MLDLDCEMMIMGRAPNCFDKYEYEYIKLDTMLNTLEKFYC